MRKSLLIALAIPAIALPIVGCGDKEEATTPVACLEGPGIWLTALASAPDQVMLDDSTSISDCLPPDQPAGQQATVGQTTVEVATILAQGIGGRGQAGADSASPPPEPAAIQAGYLVGALEKAAKESQGIHATLVDRVEAAATNRLGEAQEIQGAYQEGHEAGLDNG